MTNVFEISACAGKDAFDKARADKVLRNMKRGKGFKGKAAVYKCRHCGLWHIGSNTF